MRWTDEDSKVPSSTSPCAGGSLRSPSGCDGAEGLVRPPLARVLPEILPSWTALAAALFNSGGRPGLLGSRPPLRMWWCCACGIVGVSWCRMGAGFLRGIVPTWSEFLGLSAVFPAGMDCPFRRAAHGLVLGFGSERRSPGLTEYVGEGAQPGRCPDDPEDRLSPSDFD